MNLLVKKARKHDKTAFQQLMEQEGKAMYKIAKAILKNDDDVADAMQETEYANAEWQSFLNCLDKKLILFIADHVIYCLQRIL